MALYNDKVMEHFMNPKNVGEIENASGIGEVGNAKCGDIMRIYHVFHFSFRLIVRFGQKILLQKDIMDYIIKTKVRKGQIVIQPKE